MTMPEPIIDSHAHLFFPDYGDQVEAVMARAAEAGVEAVVNVGTRPETCPVAIEQTHRLNAHATPDWPQVYAAIGFHPHEADHVRDQDWPEIERLARRPEVVALGEFGLDYHWEHSSRDGQRRVLRRGIELALATGLPMIIHSRSAGLGVIEALDEVCGASGRSLPRGVFHCFTDPWPVAEAALARGYYIGITGIVTYPNGENVREVARRVPPERLLIETDAPFCTPEPVRSQRRKARRKGKDEPNEPAFVALVADKIAELLGLPAAEVRRRTTDNARALFGLA
jgi:TatD DNase family protein